MKVGDWVEVVNGGNWNGRVGVVGALRRRDRNHGYPRAIVTCGPDHLSSVRQDRDFFYEQLRILDPIEVLARLA